MGSFNCTGFHSRLPITGGDEIFLIVGLHLTPKYTVKYAFDPMVFAPDLTFTPIALPIFCRYDDCRHVRDIVKDKNVEALELFFGMTVDRIICNCDSDGDVSRQLAATVNEKTGLTPGDYQLTYTFDHRFVYEEIAAMKTPWDWEKSYEMTLEYTDLSSGPEINIRSKSDAKMLEIAESLPDCDEKRQMLELVEEGRKYSYIDIDMKFREHNLSAGWERTTANLNPKHVGTTLFHDNEAFSGELLLSVYRFHADLLFAPEQKAALLTFMNFYLSMRRHNWTITLPVYAGQEEHYDEIAPLYRRMAEWVEERGREAEIKW